VPVILSNAYDYAIRGNADKAKEIDLKISKLHSNLFIESNPIPVKWAMHKMGFCENGIRLPLTELSLDSQDVLEQELSNLTLIK